MKKKILLGILLGAPLGLAISTIVTILISLTLGDGAYYAVVPELIEDCGGELRAVIVQALLSLVYGAAWGGVSVVWTIDEWSILKQTLVHFAVSVGTTLPVAYFARWMPRSWAGALLYVGIFLGVYLIIWLSQYAPLKKRVREINATLEKR